MVVVGDEVNTSDPGSHRIQVFGMNGAFVRWFGDDDQFLCPDIVVVIGDQVVFDVDGTFVREWDMEGDGPGR